MEEIFMNRKTLEIVLIIATIIGVVCMAGVGYVYYKQNKKNRYVNTKYNFQLKYPEGWTVDEGKNNTAVIFFSPKGSELDVFRDNFSVVVQDLSQNPMSFKKYTEMAIMQVKVVFQRQIDVVTSESTKVAGHQGYKFVFIGKSNIFDLQLMIVWFIKEYNAYQFTYTSTAAEFDIYLPEIEAMINSFKLK